MDLGDIRVGTPLLIDGQTFIVTAASHVKMGRGGAVVKTKLKNLQTQASVDRTLKPGDTFEEADVTRARATYLYQNGQQYAFMDTTSFDQFELPASLIGDNAHWLVEGTDTTVILSGDQPVAIELPVKMEFVVAETPPGVKGNTAQGGTKQATLATGAVVSVPLFIKAGDTIRVNTTDGTYVERVKE